MYNVVEGMNKEWWTVRLDGKTVIVTGASSGIGRTTACELARRGDEMFYSLAKINKWPK